MMSAFGANQVVTLLTYCRIIHQFAEWSIPALCVSSSITHPHSATLRLLPTPATSCDHRLPEIPLRNTLKQIA